MKEYIVKFRNKIYRIKRRIRLFRANEWFIFYQNKWCIVGGVRKNDKFIPAKKMKSDLLNYKGYELVFSNTTKDQNFPLDYWTNGTLCGCIELEEIKKK
ncbi:MAG: hypothetical protein ACMXYG_07685 [Candidatus Woesearchaeota archaeon]